MEKSSIKEICEQTWEGGKGNLLRNVQGMKIGLYKQMIYVQIRSHSRKRNAKNFQDFEV